MPNIPNHVAIIMDGNRRWASARRLETLLGHDRGAKTLKMIAQNSVDAHINWLTVFAFSAENWTRPDYEVQGLMRLIIRFIKTQAQELLEANVRLRIIGRRDRFSDDLCVAMSDLEQQSSTNTGLNLTVALDYGGRQDISNAVTRIAEELESGMLTAAEINDDLLKSRMQTKILPPVDLLIRTGGEQRLSNFLLWDLSYAELFFSAKLWPDFSTTDFFAALDWFEQRQRRFGGGRYDDKHQLHAVVSD
ncbi:MAG: polyprenyl diphosphate synthase [Candidatus Puniceispirillaceae bacterium]